MRLICRLKLYLFSGFLLTLLGQQTAFADKVTMTIIGTVSIGTDLTGVFGFAPGTSLAGQNFTLTYTFEDAKGSQYILYTGSGTIPYFSGIQGGPLSGAPTSTSPGTAVLTIGGGSYSFGTSLHESNTSSAYRGIQPAGVQIGNSTTVFESVNSEYDGTVVQGSEVVRMNIIQAANEPQMTTIYDWHSPFTYTLFPADLLQSIGDFQIQVGYTNPPYQTFTAVGNLLPLKIIIGNASPAPVPQSETNGDCGPCNQARHAGQLVAGNPITISTGNKFEKITDYKTAGHNTLSFVRYYNSLAPAATLVPKMMGNYWTSNYDRYIVSNGTTALVERADGQGLTFTLSGGVWATNNDIDVKLTQSGGNWTLTDVDDTVETYTPATANSEGLAVPYGRLASIQFRNGYTQTLSYDGNGVIQSVTDSYNRSLNFTSSGGLVSTLTTPDGLVVTYGYSGSLLGAVAYSTTPQTSQTYLYENPALPNALTGIIDENVSRFATWSYDAQGRGLSSQHGAGADLTLVSYDDATGNRTVTNALGQQEIYKFTTLQTVPKVTEIDRLATATTAAATRKFTYDVNGYMASQTDWNGNLTNYVNDIHGQPTIMVEASGTPQTRTTTTKYHPTFHLPVNIVTPGLTSALTYDGNGELLTKTLTDTTLTIVPYSTNGTTRTWTNTWATFLLSSVKGPRTDVAELTSFAYDASGALTSTTNALGQITKITAHTGGGLPLTIVDPNGVTTNLTYNARQWLLSNTLSTTAGPLTTTLTYDAAGNLLKTTLPDGSALANSYDTAHRLTAVTDLFNQSISYTLDANGDRTETDTLNSASTAQRKHSDGFDALGRMLTDVGGVGQTTGFIYDNNGNALTVTDPLARVTQQAFDPLNRQTRTIDAAGGITKLTYDAHDRPVTVVDPNSGSTTFVYNGFGDVLQRISPDTGKTVYRYDPAGNLTQRVDATGATTNHTYDALDRVLTTTYPADAAENVAYSYDRAGHGFGIGRLTSVTDAAGSLSRAYDERGNIFTEKRVHGAATLLTSTTHDAASRISSITYPSGWRVTYTRDVMGRITATTATSPGGVSQPIATGIVYEPFGPVNAMTYGNGVAETRSFDLDYRLLNLTDTGAAALQNLTYSYDVANNVLKLADGLTAANTQNLGYDVLDHLTGATGNYGSLSYSYSPIGNRLTQTDGGILTSYTYAPHSNQLAAFKTGPTTETLTTTSAGSISGFSVPFGPITNLTYNQANRLATASAGTSQLAQYNYDSFGRRIVKFGSITGTTLYQYDGAGQLLEENDGAGTSRVDYVYLDDQPIATIQPTVGKVYFLHDDRLGTPQLATDSTKTVVWTASYQPFGYTSTGIGAIVQNLRLPGQEFDAETEMYHNGFREYVPELGRYVESDPIGLLGGLDAYVYVAGNPTKRIDSHGLASNPPLTLLVSLEGVPIGGSRPSADPALVGKPGAQCPPSGLDQKATSAKSQDLWETYLVGETYAAGILTLPMDVESLIASLFQSAYGTGSAPSDLTTYLSNQNNVTNLTAQSMSYSYNPPPPSPNQNQYPSFDNPLSRLSCKFMGGCDSLK